MANTGMTCPQCRAVDVDKHWSFGNGYFKCNRCGWVWR